MRQLSEEVCVIGCHIIFQNNYSLNLAGTTPVAAFANVGVGVGGQAGNHEVHYGPDHSKPLTAAQFNSFDLLTLHCGMQWLWRTPSSSHRLLWVLQIGSSMPRLLP